ncbi:alpha/beta hydrolase [Paractinoplanes lichenicola]|uniref:DUF1023 domain-containing protein n=1 Tax=Paractinoplanes lichenicola TaxID=2802976 RepID=A0ABS1VSL8_9ACTN|nr:alpha/beta hydrolase [Actinoplanes lichenicola]MBL7257011.1 hypothetical protein [Actinoplanes lichenicola]
MTTAILARLQVTDPERWRALALSWRRWAELAGHLLDELVPRLAALPAVWRGTAATAAARRLEELRLRLVLFRLHCWRADQTAGEFAAALIRAKALLPSAPAAGTRTQGPPGGEPAAALALAAGADAEAARRLRDLAAAISSPAAPPQSGSARPDCASSPAEVRRWWAEIPPEQRNWLLATEASWLARLDGLPAADRDIANRLLLDDRLAELDRAIAKTAGRERNRLREVRNGLFALDHRLADDSGPRAYLLQLDVGGEGRAVVALGDPDRADNVLTHVPGMTAGLASFGGELTRAERVAVRAAEVDPAVATSAVMWLDYDAPDFVDEAASARQAAAGAPALRHFQEGLRAAHEGPPGRQVVLGHSYGSLLVGRAAAVDGLEADSVVFVGSPGVGVDSARDLRVPPGQVWSSTARDDVIQYAAVSPASLVRDLGTMPGLGPLPAFGLPERDLWFGHNPSDPAFGAHVFTSAPGGGHIGYWEPGSPSLEALTSITLGTAR